MKRTERSAAALDDRAGGSGTDATLIMEMFRHSAGELDGSRSSLGGSRRR